MDVIRIYLSTLLIHDTMDDRDFEDLSNLDYRSVISCQRKLRELESDRPLDDKLIFHWRLRIARKLADDKRFDEADLQFCELVSVAKSLYGPFNEETSSTIRRYCANLVDLERWAEAITICEKAASEYALQQDIDEEAVVQVSIGRAHVLNKLGILCWDADRNEARNLIQHSVNILEHTLSKLQDTRWYLDEDLCFVMEYLGVGYSRLGNVDKALEIDTDLLHRKLEKYYGRLNKTVLQSFLNCAGRHAKAKLFDQAELLFRELLSRLQKMLDVDPGAIRAIPDTVAALGQLLEHCGRHSEARDLGMSYLEMLKSEDLISMGVPPSFCPHLAHWLPHGS